MKKSLPKDEIQKFIEYRKKYYKMRKKRLVIIIRNYYFFIKNNDLEKSFEEQILKINIRMF